MRKYLIVYEEAVSHIWLCNCSLLDVLIYEEILFCFLSVRIRPNQLYKQYFQLSIQLSKYIFQSMFFIQNEKLDPDLRTKLWKLNFQTGFASVNFTTNRFSLICLRQRITRYLRKFATVLYTRNFAEFSAFHNCEKSVEFCSKTLGKMWTSHRSLHSWLSEPPASQQRMTSSAERFLCIFCTFFPFLYLHKQSIQPESCFFSLLECYFIYLQ